jgi:hypothetical protein
VAAGLAVAPATSPSRKAEDDDGLPTRQSPNLCLPGTGSYGWCGDGRDGTRAKLAGPRDVSPLTTGGFLVADTGNQVIRRVDKFGRIATVAGIGDPGYTGDGGLAINAQLDEPTGVAAVADGGFVVADRSNSVIRRVDGEGRISTIAGVGKAGFSGDDGRAKDAALNLPRTVTPVGNGTYLIADTGNHRIRRISQAGTISTVAGTGVAGYSGDGGAATEARLDTPTDVERTGDGGFLIADRENDLVRHVSPDGRITTVAGIPPGGPVGPPEAATSIALNQPISVAPAGDGGFVVAEAGHIRRVFPDGTTQVVAGVGRPGYSARRTGVATAMGLAYPTAIAAPGDGSFLIADAGNDRIRRLSPSGEMATKAGSDLPLHDPGNVRGLIAGGGATVAPTSRASLLEIDRMEPTRPGRSCRDYKPPANVFGMWRYTDRRVRGRQRRRFGVKFVISAPAHVTMTVRRGRRVFPGPTRRFGARSRPQKIRLRRRLRRGHYKVELLAQFRHGARRCAVRQAIIRR